MSRVLVVRLSLLGLVGVSVLGICQGETERSVCPVVSPVTRPLVAAGPFVVERGSALALELNCEREDPWLCIPCNPEPWFVTGSRVIDPSGDVVLRENYSSHETVAPIPCEAWTGHWRLADPVGSPLDEGLYTLVVDTSIGAFHVQLEVAGGGGPRRPLVRSDNPLSEEDLTLYRLVEEQDNGGHVAVYTGEYLMIALPGNPTAGYEWLVDWAEAGPVLARVAGLSYCASSTLPGSGGTFYFRFLAAYAGQAELTFTYRRRWEVEPVRVFTVTVVVM